MDGVDRALAADRPRELGPRLAVIRTAAEVLNDLAAGFAVEEVARRGRLGHFLQAVRAMRFHGAFRKMGVSVPARRVPRMVQVRIVEPNIVVRCAIGVLAAAEEIVEVRMWAARDKAPALRRTFHDRDPHGINPGEVESE